MTADGAGKYHTTTGTVSFTVAPAAVTEDDGAVVVNFSNTYSQNPTPYIPGGGDNDDPPVEIPSNPTPLSPTPGTTTDIPDGDVAQTDVPENDIPDGETPLSATPAKTGDNLILGVLAAGVSGVGLLWVSLLGTKRRDEDASQT